MRLFMEHIITSENLFNEIEKKVKIKTCWIIINENKEKSKIKI